MEDDLAAPCQWDLLFRPLPRSRVFVTNSCYKIDLAQRSVTLDMQISWQAQHFVKLEVQISWQAAFGEPRSVDFVAGTVLGEPRSADFVAGRSTW